MVPAPATYGVGFAPRIGDAFLIRTLRRLLARGFSSKVGRAGGRGGVLFVGFFSRRRSGAGGGVGMCLEVFSSAASAGARR